MVRISVSSVDILEQQKIRQLPLWSFDDSGAKATGSQSIAIGGNS